MKGGELAILKKFVLFSLITATVLLTYQIAWAWPGYCYVYQITCEMYCSGTFYGPDYCHEDPECAPYDMCEWVCHDPQPELPFCYWEYDMQGNCCY